MLQLQTKNLSLDCQSALEVLQSEVNSHIDFSIKTNKAKQLWKNKPEIPFKEIKKELKELCVGIEICNYCECNEASDIEHIYPKSFFPESTFDWENYLLACKNCNSGYKLDKCFVINNEILVEVERKKEPKHKQIAFINPRIENPNKYFWLNLMSFEFEIHDDLSKSDYLKASKTLEILKLNERDTLKQGRKSASQEYYNQLDRLTYILNANTIEELKHVTDPIQDRLLDFSLSIEENKLALKNNIKGNISKSKHPSVWHSIKSIESKVNKKWKRLFEVFPEALNW